MFLWRSWVKSNSTSGLFYRITLCPFLLLNWCNSVRIVGLLVSDLIRSSDLGFMNATPISYFILNYTSSNNCFVFTPFDYINQWYAQSQSPAESFAFPWNCSVVQSLAILWEFVDLILLCICVLVQMDSPEDVIAEALPTGLRVTWNIEEKLLISKAYTECEIRLREKDFHTEVRLSMRSWKVAVCGFVFEWVLFWSVKFDPDIMWFWVIL